MQSVQQSFNILPSTYEDEKLELLDSEKMKCGTHGDDLSLTVRTKQWKNYSPAWILRSTLRFHQPDRNGRLIGQELL